MLATHQLFLLQVWTDRHQTEMPIKVNDLMPELDAARKLRIAYDLSLEAYKICVLTNYTQKVVFTLHFTVTIVFFPNLC